MPRVDENMLFADNLESAFIGVGRQFTKEFAVYDKEKVIEEYVNKDGMTYEDAIEFFEFNVVGAWAGEYTPVFLEKCSIEELNLYE